MPDSAGAGPGSAAVETGPSVADEIASWLGDDFASDSADTVETPPSTEPDATGTPPAERREDPSAPPVAPEGTDPAVRTGTPPADARQIAPDAALPPAPTPEADPLAGATPFTYTVNGESRALDGIQVLASGGAIVMPEALQIVQQRMSERDNLLSRAREQYESTQQYERLSAWTSVGADGKETTKTGLAGLEELRVQLARTQAENGIYDGLLANPDRLASLFTQDAEGKLSLDPERVRMLALESRHSMREAEDQVRSVLGQIRTAPSPSQAATPTVDVAKYAPSIIANAAGPNAAKLTEADRSALASQLPRYMRTVTAEDRLTNPSLTLGGPIVDGSFTQVVKDRIALRGEIASTASATALAHAANQPRLAALAVATPQRTSQLPPAPPAPKANPAADRAKQQDDAWEMMERLSSGRPAL